MSDTMTGRERLLKALKGEPTDRPSVISACQYATYELMDAVGASWPEAHRDAELMATLSGKGGAEVIGLDAIMSSMTMASAPASMYALPNVSAAW